MGRIRNDVFRATSTSDYTQTGRGSRATHGTLVKSFYAKCEVWRANLTKDPTDIPKNVLVNVNTYHRYHTITDGFVFGQQQNFNSPINHETCD